MERNLRERSPEHWIEFEGYVEFALLNCLNGVRLEQKIRDNLEYFRALIIETPEMKESPDHPLYERVNRLVGKIDYVLELDDILSQ